MRDRSSNKKIILFNGPPGSGKDTAAYYCFMNIPYSTCISFKERLFEIALTVSGMAEETWFEVYNNRSDGVNKETPLESLGGLSQREFLIKISEEWAKPVFGSEYFGEAAASRVRASDSEVFLFSDSGFVEEVNPLVDLVSGNNILIVQLRRPDCDYSGDSRDYLYAVPGVPQENIISVSNHHSQIYFETECLERVLDFTGG